MSNRPEKLFKLDDGRWVTPSDVAKVIGMSNSGARNRLKQSTDPEYVFRKHNTYITFPNTKKYRCSDGKSRTLMDASLEFGVPASVLKSRIKRKYKAGVKVIDIELLKAPLREKPKMNTKDEGRPSEKMIKDRMYFDPDGHWALINKAL